MFVNQPIKNGGWTLRVCILCKLRNGFKEVECFGVCSNLPEDTTSFPPCQGADFTLKADTPDLQAALEASIGEKFDMSFECCGVPAALNSCIEVTIPGGVVCVVANMPKTVHVDLQVACRHEVHVFRAFGAGGLF